MKNFTRIALAAICIGLSLASCKRDLIERATPSTVNCKIRQIVMRSWREQDKTGIFTYNSFGDPVTYTPLKYSPGSVKYEFRYDKDRRLTDHIGYYASPGMSYLFEFWTKYYYDNGNKVARDTTYYYGRYGQELTNHARNKGYTTYYYDGNGRISRTVYKQMFDGAFNGVISDKVYLYNEDGNLVAPGTVYDKNISLYRTHKVWMFLNRNYSVNNLSTAAAYNANKLPVNFGSPTARSYNPPFLQFISLQDCEIVYDCK